MYGDPEVVGGQRDVIANEAAAVRGTLAGLKKAPDIKSIRRKAALKLAAARGLPVYESGYSRLQIQVASPRDFPDVNGRVRTLPGIKAKFNFCLYTPFSSLRRGTKEHDEEVKLIVDALESHPKFGIGKLFWRAEDQMKIEREAHYQEAVKLLAEDEELKSRFLAQITAGEMDEAVTRTQGKRRRVIEQARGRETIVPVKTLETVLSAEDEDKQRRAAVMERAERSRDRLAQKVRETADADLDDPVDAALTIKKKKKKKHRYVEAE